MSTKQNIKYAEFSCTEQDLLDLPLHSYVQINNELWAYRVVGGWIYETLINDIPAINTVFVPERIKN